LEAARAAPDGDEGWNVLKAAPVGSWVFLLCACLALCLLDYFVLARFPNTFGWHLSAVGVCILAAIGFNLVILVMEGQQSAFQWATGYMLEWMLSMDNLFVFHMVFSAYQTPADQIHKAAFVGILGAVILRMIFFMIVSTLLNLFGWIRYPFGALLIYSGVEAARGDDDDMDPSETMLVKGLTQLLGHRLLEEYDKDGRMLVWSTDGRWQVTLLVVVIACLEFTDVLFALDSVSAKVAQIPDQYLAFSSTVLAMFGLRSMFFIIKDLVDMFELLKYGLCVILVFIGLNLILGQFVHLHPPVILCLIFSVFTISILASPAMKAKLLRALVQ
jgi:tellurite resistance protein TerC